MPPILRAFLAFLASLFRSRLTLHLEIMALRHQLGVYPRGRKRARLTPGDRVFWSFLARCWPEWRTHQSLGMDAPDGRLVQATTSGRVVEFPELNGLHHHYERVAA